MTKKIVESVNKKSIVLRSEPGKIWNDPSLADWPENDYRIIVKNLGVDVTDDDLFRHFNKYKSLARSHVIHDSSGRGKKYGFISIVDVDDYIDCMKTMNHSFLKFRRLDLYPSKWKDKLVKK